ncbi:MAG: DUF2508 family protein [Firmicutes bacterium]|nr:DUF2508 family protein [Bacillota bacterium]
MQAKGGGAVDTRDRYKELVNVWKNRLAKLCEAGKHAEERPEKEFVRSLESVLTELQAAKNYFNQVSDPDQVDLAIIYLTAAEKKYRMLLKEARLRGYRIPFTMRNLKERG